MDVAGWCTLIAAVAAAVVSIIGAIRGEMKARELHVLINSRLTQLLEATSGQARAEGRALGQSEGRREQPSSPAPLPPGHFLSGKPVSGAGGCESRRSAAGLYGRPFDEGSSQRLPRGEPGNC